MLNLWIEFNGGQYADMDTLKRILCPTCNLPHNPTYGWKDQLPVERRTSPTVTEQYCFVCEEWFKIG